ncbi:MAG TPA: ABC transporter permease subunit [Thermoanaerobaculia bacterium]|nr:ABC transporter permease subunit [Thermoanaerobaculia bacterium]
MIAALELVLVLAAVWLLTWHGVPRLAKLLARALGLRARPSPITEKRLRRFRRIGRGYWSFRVVVTAFVASLFLELLVNGEALAIHYQGRTAFPAVTQWVDTLLPFVDIPSFQRRGDFGQPGQGAVDYRLFARWTRDPETLEEAIRELEAAVTAERSDAADQAAAADAGPDDFVRRRHAIALERAERFERDLEVLLRTREAIGAGEAWIVMPLYPHGPDELRLDLPQNPPNKPSLAHGLPLGTDTAGRDVLPLMLYGFRISLTFALLVAATGYLIGALVGGIQGYYGGWIDILSQRFVEIWGSIPFLFTIMIIASLVTPSFLLLVVLMVVLQSWLGITYYIRGEFYREKAKDYVQAAIGTGVADWKIIVRHILPNALVPLVTFAPFGIVAYIGALVALDYLGFGLPPGTPSWGALLRQGLENVRFHPHLTIIPTVALAATLYTVVMIGEAVREAFDPKVFSRLR